MWIEHYYWSVCYLLGTPEQVFLDSASDSDVQFVPNSPLYHRSPLNSPANRALSETNVKLKAETDVKHDTSSADEVQPDEVIPEQKFLNVGASTSSSANTPHGDENLITQNEVYYHPVRERVKRGKTVFESSSSNDSSSSSDEWQLQSSPKRGKKYSKSIKNRRKSSKSMTTKKNSPASSSHQKLEMLPSSEKTKDDETTSRMRRGIVKSTNN